MRISRYRFWIEGSGREVYFIAGLGGGRGNWLYKLGERTAGGVIYWAVINLFYRPRAEISRDAICVYTYGVYGSLVRFRNLFVGGGGGVS